ncbi:NADH-cytochrome b5 reductase [Steccherinum ochraceum]|uniref:NADH-cytochrome b5 reductase 1 n=1 Tax=Steccherinum ochraceum TaxID=92696 RepID=A0A4R0R931_9APHY|nr:NADH-cytochrome b5 reductase [Steccherinum ochraceum]
MPSSFQLVFVSSFVLTFAALFFSWQFAQAKLREAGYEVSGLILIGLERKNQSSTHERFADSASQDTIVGTKAAGANMSSYAQLFALVLTVVTTGFIYWKFSSGSSKRKPVLDPQTWKEFPLKQKIVVSPNTAIYRFALPHPEDVLGLPIGQHISVSAEINGKDIMRSYTPTSSDDDVGHFDLLIKSYEQGNISKHVSLLKIGDTIRVKGPKGQFTYTPTLSRALGMIAGGTGITPMLQIIRAALKNPNDRTQLSLIYANVNFEDILLKKELDALAETHGGRFRVFYVLNNPPGPAGEWKGGVGFVSREQIEKWMPPTSEDVKILMCGPPPMMGAMKKHLAELKYPEPRTVSKLVDQAMSSQSTTTPRGALSKELPLDARLAASSAHDTEQPNKVHPEFADDTADIILASSDNIHFRVHSVILKVSSGWFRTLFTLPQSGGAEDDGGSESRPKEIIPMNEPASTLEVVLSMVCGKEIPVARLQSIDFIEELLQVAEKYDMPGAASIVRLSVSLSLVKTHPIRVYGIACRWGWTDVARTASAHTVHLDLLARQNVLELRHVSSVDLTRLMLLHRRRRDEFRAKLDSTEMFYANVVPGKCTGCNADISHYRWHALKYAWTVLLEEKPMVVAQKDLLEKPELLEVLDTKCPRCHKTLYNAESTLQNLRHILEELPTSVEFDDDFGFPAELTIDSE